MIKDAELNAADDKKKLETIQARNEAEANLHSVKKSLGDHGDKLDAPEKEKIEAAIKDLESVIKNDDKESISAKSAAIPALLAVSGLHHHLIREGSRTRVGLVLESGEPREVHHFSLLIGYGCGAINPYLAFESIDDMIHQGLLTNVDSKTAHKNFVKSAVKGVIKVASKMGISTIQSYRGAQIFEAVGINEAVVDRYFTWTPTRVEGVGMEEIARDIETRHRTAFPDRKSQNPTLDVGGRYQWRRTASTTCSTATRSRTWSS